MLMPVVLQVFQQAVCHCDISNHSPINQSLLYLFSINVMSILHIVAQFYGSEMKTLN